MVSRSVRSISVFRDAPPRLWWADASAATAARVAWTLAAALRGGLAWSFFGPARLTALWQIVSADELRPATILFNLQVLLGFGLAPVLIGFIRAHSPTWAPVLGVTAAGFIAASALITSVATHAGSQSNAQSLRQDIGEGFTALRDSPLLAQLMLAAAIGYSMPGPMQILLPKLARQNLALTESARGLYLGLLAASLIAGGVLALARGCTTVVSSSVALSRGVSYSRHWPSFRWRSLRLSSLRWSACAVGR